MPYVRGTKSQRQGASTWGIKALHMQSLGFKRSENMDAFITVTGAWLSKKRRSRVSFTAMVRYLKN